MQAAFPVIGNLGEHPELDRVLWAVAPHVQSLVHIGKISFDQYIPAVLATLIHPD